VPRPSIGASAVKQHAAAPATIVIDYVVRSDAGASKVTPQATGPLAGCLADAVKTTQFAPRLALGQRVSL
jgi:hypothetical protein